MLSRMPLYSPIYRMKKIIQWQRDENLDQTELNGLVGDAEAQAKNISKQKESA